MINIYCISGLGADQQVFKNLHISGARLLPVDWVEQDKYDDLACYAQKLLSQITEQEPYILGYSFGGMLATEIAKIIPVKKVFIVSSVPTTDQLPRIGNIAKLMARKGLLPVGMFLKAHKLMYTAFGAQSADDKKLVDRALENTKPDFARWATGAIANWKNHTRPTNLIHIHGTADRIIKPAEELQPDYWIKGGTHLMIYNMASYIAPIIQLQLSDKFGKI